MIKKILLILTALLSLTHLLAYSKQPSSVYISADLSSPEETFFQVLAEDKFTLEGVIKKNRLLITQGNFTYKKIPFRLNCDLESSGLAKISFYVSSEMLKITVEAECDKESVVARNLSIDTKDTWIQAAALLNTAKRTIEISGQSVIKLPQIIETAEMLGLNPGRLKEIKPAGSLETDFTFSSDSSLENWETKAKISSEKIKISGIEAQNLVVDISKQENILTVNSLSAQVYKGNLDLKGFLDLVQGQAQANLVFQDMDIAEAAKKFSPKKHLFGTLTLEADLKNIDLRQWDKMDGQGKISLKEAQLWETGILKDLGKILSIPEFENIIFEQGSSNLVFSGKDINFKDLFLLSPAMDIKGEGRLDTKGGINFELSSQFSNEIIKSSGGLKKYIGELMEEADLDIKIYGTLEKPRYRILPAIPSPAKKIKSLIEELIID